MFLTGIPEQSILRPFILFKFDISKIKQDMKDFSQAVIANTDYLRPYAISLTRNTETAKDLIQETLLKAISNKNKFRDGTNIKAWLYTIMKNIFINDYRKASKRKLVHDNGPGDVMLHNHLTTRNGGERALLRDEIEKAIAGIPGDFSVPFLMHFKGYKYEEISKELVQPLGTIKSRIHFARKLLKESLVHNRA